MPAFVRTEKDEARWQDAKKEAAEQGKGDNYAYITAIYNRMKKSFPVSPMPTVAAIGSSFHHGEVPGKTSIRMPSIATDIDPGKMPKEKSAMEMKLPLPPCRTPQEAMRGMGFSPETESNWSRVIENISSQSANELRFRQNLMPKLLENFANDPTTRKELYQRGLAYYRTTGKPETPDILSMKAIDKKQARGKRKTTPGGHKLELRGRKDPVKEIMQTTRALPAGTIRVHYSSEHKGYVRAMKRADGTWKVLGRAGKKKQAQGKEKQKKKDHSKPRLTVHSAEHNRGHDAHHVAEDHHETAKENVMAMKAKAGSRADDRHQSKRALPKERRKGSKKNPKGSAEGGKKITFSAATTKTLQDKVKAHNEKVDAPSKKATLGALKAVYRRGAGAFSVSHRPGMTRAQWAFARVNHFLHLLKTGRPKDKKYVTDNDLLPKGHPRSTKKSQELVLDLEKAKRYNHIDFKPPQSVADAAKLGLEYRKKASPSNRGGLTAEEAGKHGIGSGVQRAANLKNRHTMSPKTVRMMSRFFSRHEKNKAINPKFRGTPWNDKGYVAWLLWGGDPGKSWANKIVRQMEAADKKADKTMTPAGPITTLYRAKGPFADDKNKKYPVNDYEHTRAAISYFSMPKNADKYSEEEQKKIWSRITAAAKKFGIKLDPKAGPPSVETKKSESSKENKMNDVFKAIMERDVEVMRPNKEESEFVGVPEDAWPMFKEQTIVLGDPAVIDTIQPPDKVVQELREGIDVMTATDMARNSVGSGDADGLGGATEGSEGIQGANYPTNKFDQPAKADPGKIVNPTIGKSHPLHTTPLSFSEQGGDTWHQGEDSQVLYSSSEDKMIAAAMEKSDNLCIGAEPSLRNTLMQPRTGPCGHVVAKALTVCPDCGTDASGFSGQVQGIQVSKSVETRLSAPADLAPIRLVD